MLLLKFVNLRFANIINNLTNLMTQHIYIVKSKKNPDFLELFYSKIFADKYINYFKEIDNTLYSQTKPVLESQTNDKLYYVYKTNKPISIGKITAIKFLKNYFIKSFTTDDVALDDFLKNKIIITEDEIKAQKIRLVNINTIYNK